MCDVCEFGFMIIKLQLSFHVVNVSINYTAHYIYIVLCKEDLKVFFIIFEQRRERDNTALVCRSTHKNRKIKNLHKKKKIMINILLIQEYVIIILFR
jgi:hypothetical protein